MDHNDVAKYSIMSQLGVDSTYALRKSIDDILANGDVPTPAFKPQPSTSSGHPKFGQHPTRAAAEGLKHASAMPMNDKAGSQATPQWSRSSYPRTAKIHVPDGHSPLSEVEKEQQSPSQIVEAEQNARPPKPLRRTVGSGRLRAAASEGADLRRAKPTTPTGPASEPRSTENVNARQGPDDVGHALRGWQRGAYPLQHSQGPSLSSSHQKSNTAVADEQTQPAAAVDSLPKDPVSIAPTRRLPDSHAHHDRLRIGERLSVQDVEALTPTPDRGQATSPVDSVPKRFRRNAYPLQTQASQTDLQSIPSSPSSQIIGQALDGRHPPPAALTHAAKQEHVKTKQHRQYPLQSPASTFSLRNLPTPPASSEEDEGGYERPAEAQEGADPRRSKKTFRGIYPMQHAPSIANLNHSSGQGQQNPPAKDDSRQHEQVQSTHPHGKQQSETRKYFPRNVYPMQHLPSVADLRHLSNGSTVATESNEIDANKPASGSSENGRSPSRLHTAEGLPGLQVQPPTPPTEQEEYDTRMHDRNLASKTLRQWRRQIYPLQAGETEEVLQTSHPPTPRTRSPSPGPIHLPKNMPAVTNAEETHRGNRTIIVCLDGTGDKFDDDNSNIVQLVSSLKKDDPRQVTYYQAGIGTYNKGGLNTGFSAAMDMAVGSELGLHVRDAYQFLMHSYKEGDKICIFGFSRGAYTARCLAGMVHKVGLLPPRNLQQIAFAYEFYADTSQEGWNQSRLFKATFSIDVSVYFLGCFDSVASVGFIPRQLPLSSTSANKCRYFRHAMALDERRAKFKVCRFEAKDLDKDDIEEESKKQTPSRSEDEEIDQPWHPHHTEYGPSYHPNVTNEEYERLAEPDTIASTDVSEVWFAGAHADVGGGAVENTKRHKLAQIPLRWMIRQAFECNTGILFKTKKLAEFGLDVHTLWPRYRRLQIPSMHGPPLSFLEKYDPLTTGLPPRSVRRAKLVPTDKWDDTTSSSASANPSALSPAATAPGHAHRTRLKEPLYHLKSHKDEDWTPEQVEDFYDALAPLNDQLVDAPNWWLLEAWPVQYKVPLGNGHVELRTGPNWGRYRGLGDREPRMHWTVRQREHMLGYQVKVRTAPCARWQLVV